MIDSKELGAEGGRARALSLSPERDRKGGRDHGPGRKRRSRGCTTEALTELTVALDKAGFYLIRVVENGKLRAGIVPKSWSGR